MTGVGRAGEVSEQELRNSTDGAAGGGGRGSVPFHARKRSPPVLPATTKGAVPRRRDRCKRGAQQKTCPCGDMV